jgi:arabinogalactan oligomer/maltooligosaccharide transport system permease protein
MLITSGILMNIPADLYESARIDGAGVVKTFTHITLPYMIFVTTPYLITQFVGNINNFNVIYLLTGGGPLSLDYYQGGKTDLLVTWLYKLTVNNQDYNLASAIGIIIFLITASLSLLVYNLSGSSRKEESFQ